MESARKHKAPVGIVGATGYTGSELARLLLRHPGVELKGISSESRAGEPFSDVHPFFAEIFDDKLVTARELFDNEEIQLRFLALPHGISMDYVKSYRDNEARVVDLSGDFRLDGKETYDAWYPKKHSYEEGFADAAYGIPELNRDVILKKKLIANPGCYPTASLLGLAPLIVAGIVEPDIIIDAKSGVTGAGVKPGETTHFSNVSDNFKAYGLRNHRHTIEIELHLNTLNNKRHRVQFTPHLLPVDRGILATMYCKPSVEGDSINLEEIYKQYYADEYFIRVRKSPPSIKDVRGTNFCDIYSCYDPRTGRIIIVSAIDNLVKGAAGQAIQNMNLLLGFPENCGLDLIPLRP